jgi:DNA-binding transcriptional LysR family regulator
VLTYIETLAALAEVGTMTRAATRLRITQSAVSKRIATLEHQVGQKLVEPAGRRVRLTPFGIRLLDRATPHLAALKEALLEETAPQGGRLVIGVSESILASWGPPLLARVCAALPQLDLSLNAHRSPVAVEHVRSGEYMLALVAGVSDDAPDLKAEKILEEPMVVVPSGLKSFPLSGTVPVLTIEPASATWAILERRLRRLSPQWTFRLEVERTLQSFACIVQMARHGLGNGLVPAGVARAMGISSQHLIYLPEPGLTRPIGLVGRATTLAIPLVQEFSRGLRRELEAVSDFIA